MKELKRKPDNRTESDNITNYLVLWLQSAESAGFRFEARGGKLIVSPASAIDEAGGAFIRANRDALLELAEGREACRQAFAAELGIKVNGHGQTCRYVPMGRE